MTVGRICRREVDTARANETVRSAAQRMGNRGVGTLVVLDGKQRPIGILTDRDVTLCIVAAGKDADATLVGDVMTEELSTVVEETPIEDALARMRARGVRRLPVVKPDGTLAGIVSLDDVLSLLAEELAEIGRFLDKTSPERIASS
jgi:CBS domain-containing protein